MMHRLRTMVIESVCVLWLGLRVGRESDCYIVTFGVCTGVFQSHELDLRCFCRTLKVPTSFWPAVGAANLVIIIFESTNITGLAGKILPHVYWRPRKASIPKYRCPTFVAADFGVSAQLNSTMSMRQTTTGTPLFMAPEVHIQAYHTCLPHACLHLFTHPSCIITRHGSPTSYPSLDAAI